MYEQMLRTQQPIASAKHDPVLVLVLFAPWCELVHQHVQVWRCRTRGVDQSSSDEKQHFLRSDGWKRSSMLHPVNTRWPRRTVLNTVLSKAQRRGSCGCCTTPKVNNATIRVHLKNSPCARPPIDSCVLFIKHRRHTTNLRWRTTQWWTQIARRNIIWCGSRCLNEMCQSNVVRQQSLSTNAHHPPVSRGRLTS